MFVRSVTKSSVKVPVVVIEPPSKPKPVSICVTVPLPVESVSQVTVPSGLITRIELPAKQELLTRYCTTFWFTERFVCVPFCTMIDEFNALTVLTPRMFVILLWLMYVLVAPPPVAILTLEKEKTIGINNKIKSPIANCFLILNLVAEYLYSLASD